MKKILTILILLQLVYSAGNAQIKLIGNITTNGKASYPTHIDSLGKGGMMVMPTIGSRDSIPSLRRKFGMLVYVQQNDSLYKLKKTASGKRYTDNSDWVTIGLSSTEDVDKFLKYAKTSDSLFIIGNTTIDSNLTVKKDLEVKGNLILNTGLQFNDSLVVSKGARIQQGMKLIGKLDLRDTLSVKGISILDDSLYVKGISVLSKIVNDSTTITSKLRSDSTSITAKLRSDSTDIRSKLLLDSTNITAKLRSDSTSITAKLRSDSTDIRSKILLDSTNITAKLRSDFTDIRSKLLLDSTNITAKLRSDSTSITAKLRSDSTDIRSKILLDSTNITAKLRSDSTDITFKLRSDSTSITAKLRSDSTVITAKLRSDSTTINRSLVDSSLSLNARINTKVNTLNGVVQNTLTVNGKATITDSLTVRGNTAISGNLTVRGTNILSKLTTDSTTLLTRLIDSASDLNNRINSKVNVADTSTMLSNLLMKSDTATMLNARFARDTVSISNRIDVLANSTSSEKIKFTKDFPVRIATGKTFGKYANGSTIPATGKTLDELLTDITTEVIRPTYSAPSVTVGSPNAGTFEVGANLGTINLTSNFTQRDAGAIINTKYLKSGTELAGTTDIISALTTPLQFTVSVQYAMGSVKLNNIDVPDSTGIIQAGTISSALTTLFTPAAKKYYGSSLSNNITDADLLAGSSEFVSNNASILKSSFTIPITGGSKYIYYAYPVKYVDNITSYPTSIAIWVGGFESTGSFTKTTKSVTNAQNFTQDYYIYVWKNTSNADITNIEVK